MMQTWISSGGKLYAYRVTISGACIAGPLTDNMTINHIDRMIYEVGEDGVRWEEDEDGTKRHALLAVPNAFSAATPFGREEPNNVAILREEATAAAKIHLTVFNERERFDKAVHTLSVAMVTANVLEKSVTNAFGDLGLGKFALDIQVTDKLKNNLSTRFRFREAWERAYREGRIKDAFPVS